MLVDQTPGDNTIDRGRSGVCNTQGRGGLGIVTKQITIYLDLPRDLGPGRQTDGTTENKEG